MDNAGVLGGHNSWDVGLATDSKKDVAGQICADLTSLGVARGDLESLEGTILLDRSDSDNIVLVADNIVKVAGAPPQVVLELGARRKEGVEVGEVDQPVVLVQVVEEGEVGARVPQRGEVLDKGNLHVGAGQEHTSVPGKVGLLLKEENLGLLSDGTGLHGVVERDGNRHAGRAEANADKVVDLRGIGWPEIAALGRKGVSESIGAGSNDSV